MEKKQTAVEWLIEKIHKDLIHKSMGQIYGQAKQMEREQMKNVYLTHCVKAERLRKLFEQQFQKYYNETYGGNNE
jgi:metal-dependent hydrolase (beta-lactamase superfamily II)